MNGAHFLLDVLARSGVRTLFGLPGSTEAPLLAALGERDDLRYVLGLHEGAVVSMADGYARASGRPGVAVLHTTVGTLNGASQIYNSFQDGSPVVAIAGHKDRTVLSESGFCAHPHLPEAVRPFTKWAHQALSTADLGCDLWRALHTAMTPPMGPAFLAVPEDLMRAEVPAGAPSPATGNQALWDAAQVRPDSAACVAAAHALASARWPVAVVGSAARGSAGQVRHLSDRLAMPVVCTDFTDLVDLPFPTADPRYLGLYGEDPGVLEGCDLLLVLGARLSYPFSALRHPRLPAGARVVHVHPDPGEVGRRVPTDVGIVASPDVFLRELAAHLDEAGCPAAPAREERLSMLRTRREQALARERSVAATTPLPVDEVAAELNDVLPADAIIVDEGVRSSTRLLRHLRLGDGQALLRSSGGALGWGVPAAIGASLAQPGRPVVALVGDGSLHFSVQAIWTAVRQGAPVTVVVLDNGGYLAVKQAVGRYAGSADDPPPHPGSSLPAIDHAGVCGGYGASTARAEKPGEVSAAVAAALATGRATVITVPVAEIAS